MFGTADGLLAAHQPAPALWEEPSSCSQLDLFTANDAMIAMLEAQLQVIWPQERALIAQYDLPANPAILDVGCGTGELERELARMWPTSAITGVDVVPSFVEIARRRTAGLSNVSLRAADAAHLPFAAETFDAVFCRHVLHAVTNPGEILDEMLRVLKPGGRLHLLPEDYGMIHDSSSAREVDRLWQAGWIEAGKNTGIDLCIGRKLPAMLLQRGLWDVQADFVVIDSLRVDRKLLKQVFEHWRDLATPWLTENTSVHRSELSALFAGFLAIANDPAGYVAWQIPIVSAVKPAGAAQPGPATSAGSSRPPDEAMIRS